MPQSLTAAYLHFVYSTKDRRPVFADTQLRKELHAYLGGICQRLDCPPLAVGGVEDHVHLLVGLGREATMAGFAKETKRVSNLWLKQQGAEFRDFRWQAGYGAFSVSESRLQTAINYVQNQEKHHRKATFQDEMRKLLKKHRLEFDERYVWD